MQNQLSRDTSTGNAINVYPLELMNEMNEIDAGFTFLLSHAIDILQLMLGLLMDLKYICIYIKLTDI